mgnify:FL=1
MVSATSSRPELGDLAEAGEAARRTWWHRLRSPRLGLRARITLAFTLSAALLSTLLAGTTWALTRENILNQRESSATRQATTNADLVAPLFAGTDPDAQQITDLLGSLQSDSPSRSLVRVPSGDWFGTSADYGRDAVPAALLTMVEGASRPGCGW